MAINKKRLKELKAKAPHLEPVVWIGKSGINAKVIEETKKQLKKRNLIKVKMLKSALAEKSKKDIAKEIAEKTDSIIVSQVGFIVVLYKANIAKSI